MSPWSTSVPALSASQHMHISETEACSRVVPLQAADNPRPFGAAKITAVKFPAAYTKANHTVLGDPRLMDAANHTILDDDNPRLSDVALLFLDREFIPICSLALIPHLKAMKLSIPLVRCACSEQLLKISMASTHVGAIELSTTTIKNVHLIYASDGSWFCLVAL